jgi:hypothetical protein
MPSSSHPCRWLALLCAGLLAVLSPALTAARDEPKKEEPKKEEPKKAIPGVPDVEDFLKRLPQNLDPKQVEDIRKKLEELRALQERTMKLTEEARARAQDEQRRALDRLGRGRQTEDRRLGIQFEPPSTVLIDQFELPKDRGLVVTEVRPDSPAAKAGLKQYDVLVELDGKPVPSKAEEFVKLLQDIKPNTPVDAVVMRKGKKETVKGISLPEAPKVPERPGLRGREHATVTVTRTGDNITALLSEGTLHINLRATAADGKVKVETINVIDGRAPQRYDSIEKVPEAHREKVKTLIETAEKLVGGAKKE